MSKLFFTIAVMLAIAPALGLGQDSFVCQVEGMWRSGDYAGVLAAATNTASDILRVAPQIGTERFAEVRELVVQDAQAALELIPQYPPDEYAADLLKAGTITNKHLPCDYAIRALEEDGYIQ